MNFCFHLFLSVSVDSINVFSFQSREIFLGILETLANQLNPQSLSAYLLESLGINVDSCWLLYGINDVFQLFVDFADFNFCGNLLRYRLGKLKHIEVGHEKEIII